MATYTNTFYDDFATNNARAKLVVTWSDVAVGATVSPVTLSLYIQPQPVGATITGTIDTSILYWNSGTDYMLTDAVNQVITGTTEKLLQTGTYNVPISQTATTRYRLSSSYEGIDGGHPYHTAGGYIDIAASGVPNAHPTSFTGAGYNFAKTGGTTNTLTYTQSGAGGTWDIVSATITSPTIATTAVAGVAKSGNSVYLKLSDTQINQLIAKWDADGYITSPVVSIVTSATGLSNVTKTGVTNALPSISSVYSLANFTATRGSESAGATPITFAVICNASSLSPYRQADTWPAAAVLPIKFYKGTVVETATVTKGSGTASSYPYTATCATTLASANTQDYSASILISTIRYSTLTQTVTTLQNFLTFKKVTTNSGYVGINNGAPVEALDIIGNLKVSGSILGTGVLNTVYPVGSIYISTVSTNPGTLFGGTWVAAGVGRTLIGAGTSDITFTAGATGGSSTGVATHAHNNTVSAAAASHAHNLSAAGWALIAVGSYVHAKLKAVTSWTPTNRTDVVGTSTAAAVSSATELDGATDSGGGTGTISNANAGTTNGNLPPYIVVYIWNRTA